MKAPAPHRFSVEDYHRMAELGFLAPDARVELLDGEIHDMSPIGPLHSGIVNRLIRFFSLSAKGRWIVSAQNPVGLDKYSEPEPDLALLKPAPDDYVSHHPTPDDVLLLIEVADSSLDFDHGKKLPIYARVGIRELWIVNLQEPSVEIYREPHFTGYDQKSILQAGDKASPTAFPDVLVDVGELLKR
jgi:Uma2 family endonuclease